MRMILRWVRLQSAAAEGLLRGRGHYTLQRAYCAEEGTTLLAETTLLRRRTRTQMRMVLRWIELRNATADDLLREWRRYAFAAGGTLRLRGKCYGCGYYF